MEIPADYGGSELSFTSACLAVEEISRVDPSVAILVDIHNTLTNNAVRFWGSLSLQEEWLPRLATDTPSSFCLSEAGSGSDAFAMKTTATISSDGSYYTINGSKLWISNAIEAGVFLIFANVDPSRGYKGITAFMVDAETEGITVGNPEQKVNRIQYDKSLLLSRLLSSRHVDLSIIASKFSWDSNLAQLAL